MANKLKNMRLTSVDLVRNGANQEADICLFKSADPEEDPVQPTTAEKNIFKRFIDWLRQNPADEPLDDEETVEKDYTTFDALNATRESNEKLWQYTSALTESIRSIQADNDLDMDEKYKMMLQSLDQFDHAMEELLGVLCRTSLNPDGTIKAAKSAPEEDLEKANPYHGADGRFTSASGAGGGAAAGGLNDKAAGIMAACKEPWDKPAAALKIGALADEMQEGDKVTFQHRKHGEMEFVRTKAKDSIMAFNCLSHTNVNGSPQHMRGWLEDSVNAGSIPKFTQGSNTKKSARFEEIESVEKFNPYHGSDGRFASASGGGSTIAGTGGRVNTSGKPAFASTKPKFDGNGNAKITVTRGTMGKDWTEQKLTINSGMKRTTKDSVEFEGMDKAGNSYKVKYRLGGDGKADYSRCDVIEKSADIDEIEEV